MRQSTRGDKPGAARCVAGFPLQLHVAAVASLFLCYACLAVPAPLRRAAPSRRWRAVLLTLALALLTLPFSLAPRSAKSTVASEATQAINPAVRINALQNRVSPETEGVFNDAFWDKLHLVSSRVQGRLCRRAWQGAAGAGQFAACCRERQAPAQEERAACVCLASAAASLACAFARSPAWHVALP